MENNLPEGWAEVELKMLGKYVNGRAFKPSEWELTGLPIIRIQNLNNPNAAFNYSTQKFDQRFLVQKGDLLMAWSASLGVFIWDRGDAWLNQHIFKVIENESLVTRRFLYYSLIESIRDFYGKTHGTGMVHITKPVFESHEIPLPPLPEQHRIVAKLDALMERVERNKQRLDKIPTLLKRFRQSVLAAAVSGRLTDEWRRENRIENNFEISSQFEIDESYRELYELPGSWQWVALGNYVKCNRGRFSVRPRNDPRYFGGDIPFIQIGDLPRDGGYIIEHAQTLNEEGLKVSKLFPKDTVVLAIVGATIANSGILAYDMCFTDSLVGINKGELKLNIFIEYYIRNEKENIRQLSYASGGQPNIKLELLNAYPFPLPPLEEQHEIVRRVEQLFAFADKIEARYIKAKAMLDRLPQSILAKAFRGELVPQDPEDEPAEVLLKRVRAEKGISQSKKSTKK